MSDHFRKLENMYLRSAPINTELFPSTQLTVEKGKAIVQLTLKPSYFHALGALHGSVYFKLLDDAAFFAVNSLVKDVFVLTTNFNINLIRPVNKGVIKAIGQVKFASRQLWIAEASLYDENNKEIAFGTGHFARSSVVLSPDIGYSL